MQDAVEVARFICHNQGIDLDDPEVTFRILVTEIDWQTGVVISATNLPRLASLSPDDRGWYPSYPWLEALLEEYRYIIILPAWLVDLQGAIRSNQAAAYRFVRRINPRRLPALGLFRKKADELGTSREEARLQVMTEVLLQVLAHSHEALPMWSGSNPMPLQHPDGTTETAIPYQLLHPWAFRQWAEVETIRGTKNMLDEEPLRLGILINPLEDEDEPSQLWWYSKLPPLSPGGRPRGRTGITEERFRHEYPQKYFYLLELLGELPSQADVAAELGIHERTLRNYLSPLGFNMPWPPKPPT